MVFINRFFYNRLFICFQCFYKASLYFCSNRKIQRLFSKIYSFAILYSGQRTIGSLHKHESSTWSCGREAKTTDSRADCCIRHSTALFCHSEVRLTFPLFSNQFQEFWKIIVLDMQSEHSTKLSAMIFRSRPQWMFHKPQQKLQLGQFILPKLCTPALKI